IAPSAETLLDGSYPLAANFHAYIPNRTFGEEAGAPFAWSLLSEAAINQLELLNLAVPAFDQIRLARSDVYERIEEELALAAERRMQEEAEAAEEALEAEQNATAEPTPDATAEASEDD
ncbi:MAG: hypothetical protein ACLFTK_17180, partial [Anaerolineales bacterium]